AGARRGRGGTRPHRRAQADAGWRGRGAGRGQRREDRGIEMDEEKKKTVEITSAMVKELREKTGAGMMDCKKALIECNGDLEKSIDWLRQKGLASAGKKASRSATEGAVGSYIHLGGKIGVIVEVNCETDFTAKNEKFQALVKDIAMQIAWSNPEYVRREDVPEEWLDREKAIYRAQLPEQGKPEASMD